MPIQNADGSFTFTAAELTAVLAESEAKGKAEATRDTSDYKASLSQVPEFSKGELSKPVAERKRNKTAGTWNIRVGSWNTNVGISMGDTAPTLSRVASHLDILRANIDKLVVSAAGTTAEKLLADAGLASAAPAAAAPVAPVAPVSGLAAKLAAG